MKRSRFSERTDHWHSEGAPGRAERGGALPEARGERADLLQVALEVWRHGGVGREAAEGARGGERQAEEAPGGVDAGRGDAARDARKKLLRPSSRRSAVNWAITEKGYSQRRACRLVGIDPRVYRYRSTRGDDDNGHFDDACASCRPSDGGSDMATVATESASRSRPRTKSGRSSRRHPSATG
jgi:hypothetical protein